MINQGKNILKMLLPRLIIIIIIIIYFNCLATEKKNSAGPNFITRGITVFVAVCSSEYNAALCPPDMYASSYRSFLSSVKNIGGDLTGV